jgi:hypothetical protein
MHQPLVELHSSPIKWIEIHEFLDPDTLKRWSHSLAQLTLTAGDVVTPQGSYSVNRVKQNSNAWLTPPNDLAFEFRDLAWSQQIRTSLEAMDDCLFQAHSRMIDEGSFLYSEYQPGQYYAWHRDRAPYLTYNLVIEAAREGGEFEMTTQVAEPFSATERVANRSNTLIIFPSYLVHQVRPVIQGTRRTLQYFQNAKTVASQ